MNTFDEGTLIYNWKNGAQVFITKGEYNEDILALTNNECDKIKKQN